MNTPPNKPRKLDLPEQIDFKQRKEHLTRKKPTNDPLTNFEIANSEKENTDNNQAIPSVSNGGVFGRIVFEER